jgi:tetratricopeptide (TPR) repeat protein
MVNDRKSEIINRTNFYDKIKTRFHCDTITRYSSIFHIYTLLCYNTCTSLPQSEGDYRMISQNSGQASDQQPPGGKRFRRRVWLRNIIVAMVVFTFCCYIASIFLYVLYTYHEIQYPWINPLITILTVLGSSAGVPAAILTFLQFLHGIFNTEEQHTEPVVDGRPYQDILGMPPLSSPDNISQREELVKEIEQQLMERNTSAVVLVGLARIGKSTLAALVSQYIEKQRRQRIRYFLRRFARGRHFTAPPIWLHIDSPNITLHDIARTLFKAFGKPFPTEFYTFNAQHQALVVHDLLNSTKKARLVVIDQLDTLLDVHTGQVLNSLYNVGDWFDVLNSQTSKCCILFTSRVGPRGSRDEPYSHMKMYKVGGLGKDESIEILRNHASDASDEELRSIAEHADGHAHILKSLIELLSYHPIASAAHFLQTHEYHLKNDIAKHFNQIFRQQLNQQQRELLLAFSVFHEPVTLEVALSIRDAARNLSPIQRQAHLTPDLDGLLAQHLVEREKDGRYKLPTVVARYVEGHFSDGDEHDNLLALHEAHRRAAEYYERLPLPRNPQNIDDIHAIIEAIRHHCEAGEWRKAYEMIEAQNIFSSLKDWGNNQELQEIFQRLLPPSKWGAEPGIEALIYKELGSIYYDLDQKESALEYYALVLKIYRNRGEWKDESEILKLMGKICTELGRYNPAKTYYEQALTLCQQENGHMDEPGLYENLAGICSKLQEDRQARKYYALFFNSPTGSENGNIDCITLTNIADLFLRQGNSRVVLACYRLAEHSQNCDDIKSQMKALEKRVSKQQYRSLSKEVDTHELEIIRQAMNE